MLFIWSILMQNIRFKWRKFSRVRWYFKLIRLSLIRLSYSYLTLSWYVDETYTRTLEILVLGLFKCNWSFQSWQKKLEHYSCYSDFLHHFRPFLRWSLRWVWLQADYLARQCCWWLHVSDQRLESRFANSFINM